MSKNVRLFCAMPNDGSLDYLWTGVVQSAAHAVEASTTRVKTISSLEDVISSITTAIDECDVFVALAGTRNPNVYLEIGYAMACKKSCVVITNEATQMTVFGAVAVALDGNLPTAILQESLEWILRRKLSNN